MGGEALEHGEEEGGGLSGAGAGHGDDVVAAHDEGDGLALDGRGHAVPAPMASIFIYIDICLCFLSVLTYIYRRPCGRAIAAQTRLTRAAVQQCVVRNPTLCCSLPC